MLYTENLTIALRGRAVLQGITLSVPCGSLVVVIGPNGAGKTTLLRALSGDIRPSSGQVTMADKPLAQWTLQERAQHRAVLEQDYSLSFPLRCLDVVLLGRMPHQARLRSADRRLDDLLIARSALDAVELGDRAHDSYEFLSGGQKQLVQLARALAQIWEPPVGHNAQRCLLLDEPTASLDLRYQHMILSRAQQLAAEGVAVLAILHDLNLAAQYADTLILLKNGTIAAQGSPAHVLTPTLIHDVFGVSASRIDAGERPVIISAAASQLPNHQKHSRKRYAQHANITTEHPVRAPQAKDGAA